MSGRFVQTLALCRKFELDWRAGIPARIEDCLAGASPKNRGAILSWLVGLEVELRTDRGEIPAREEYLQRFPSDRNQIEAAFEDLRSSGLWRAPSIASADDRSGPTQLRAEDQSTPLQENLWPDKRNSVPGSQDRNSPCPSEDDPGRTVGASCGFGGGHEDDAYAADSGSGRYQLVRLHATGGIGEVWLARDVHLGREVALKRLRSTTAPVESARQRFLKEARISSRLQHPGIASVYELVETDDEEQAFYTMRLISGKTLSEGIADFHQKRRRGESGQLALTELLGAFVRICEVIAYAHSRGVIHRDMKGQNIVIGDFGEVVVLDWGLAKELTDPTIELGSEVPTPEPWPIPFAATGTFGETPEGVILGTPGYMAPEQALGQSQNIDGRTDVYGLGAILYEILTGQPPFRGNRNEVIRKLVDEPPVRPRQIDATVAPALEAICLKCLSKSGADRYATASDVAEDVKRYLADEPVTVFEEPWMTIVRRWAGRHRTTAIASLASLLVGFGILSVATVYLQAANRRETNSRDRAEKHFRLALTAVDRFYTQIAQDERLKSHDLESLRQELLREASKFYTEIVPEQGHEPRVQSERSEIQLHLARLTRELGQPKDALALSEQSTQQYRELAARYPQEMAYRVGIAQGLDSQGEDLVETGDVAAAKSSFREAITIWRQLAHDNPARRDFLLAEAMTLNRIGRLLCFSVEQADECEEALERCLQVCDQLAQLDARSPVYRDVHAEALLSLGESRGYRNFDNARPLLEEGLRMREQLGAEQPNNLSLQSKLVFGCLQFASAYSNARADERIPQVYQRVKDISERLVRTHPSVPQFAENHARIGLVQAIHLARNGRDHQAASKLTQESLSWAPDSGTVLVFAACAYCMCSEAAREAPGLDASRRRRASEEFLSRAMELLRKASSTNVFRQPGVLEGLKTTDPDFAPLRGREDFQRLLRDLERPTGTLP